MQAPPETVLTAPFSLIFLPSSQANLVVPWGTVVRGLLGPPAPPPAGGQGARVSPGCPCLAMLHLPGAQWGFASLLCQVLPVVSPVSPATSRCLGAGQSVLTLLSGPKAADVWENDSSVI